MQEQEIEVSFCDLCGTSVPAGDIEGRKAVQHQGKTVGACCLTVLREGGAGPAAAVLTPVASAGRAVSDKSGGDGGRLLTVAIVLMAAFAGGIMFLDGRLSRLEDAWTKSASDAATRQKADSEALLGLSVKADGLAARSDLDVLEKKTIALGKSLDEMTKEAKQRQTVLEQAVGVLGRQLTETTNKLVDYRPLFEDLRQRHTRAMAAIEGMRSEVAAVPASVAAVADGGDPVPVVGPEVPAELAEHVRKLAAADPAVRFEAVDVLVDSKNLKVLPFLLPLAKDPDAFVRRLTVEGLREFQKAEAVDALIEALRDEDENVCDTAWRSLRDVTGQKFKFDAAANKEARGRAAKAWQGWWAKARPTFGT